MSLVGGSTVRLGADGTSHYARWGAKGIAYADSDGLRLVASPGEPPRDLTSPPRRTHPAGWAPVDWSAEVERLLLALACEHCVESAVLDLATGQVLWQGEVAAVAISRDGRRVLVQDACGAGAPASVDVGYPGRVVDIGAAGAQAIPFRLLTCGPSWSPAPPPP